MLVGALAVLFIKCVLEESGEVSSEQLLYPELKVLKYMYVSLSLYVSFALLYFKCMGLLWILHDTV